MEEFVLDVELVLLVDVVDIVVVTSIVEVCETILAARFGANTIVVTTLGGPDEVTNRLGIEGPDTGALGWEG